MRSPSNGPISDFTLHWLEDEIFFSICARQHLYLGNMKATSTLTWLFGSPKAGTNHDFPFNLDALNEKARLTWVIQLLLSFGIRFYLSSFHFSPPSMWRKLSLRSKARH